MKRRSRATIALVTTAALAAGLGLVHAARPAVGTQPAALAVGRSSVTLITGDRVSLINGEPQIVPRPGGRVSYLIQRAGRRLLVIPSDAVGGLRSGRLDPRLFDVKGLLNAGFGDDATSSVPLIVTGGGASLRGGRSLPSLGATAATLPKNEAADRWSRLRADRTVGKVWLDGRLRPLLDHSRTQIGADRTGSTGRGVPVAVLDTGLDRAHPDLADRVAAIQDFTGTGPSDEVGHGTHVAGIVAGTGTASAGRYRGVAPGARLLIGKVCTPDGCPESAIIAGMEWAADRGAKVVNLSLGELDEPGVDPVEAALDELSRQPGGPVFVVAAGNDGRTRSMNSPASADEAMAVGAVDRSDRLAPFSSRGPRVDRGRIKPDVVAPGAGITSAQAGTGGYTALNGTSMATPHVTGVIAQLAEKFPALTGPELKNLALSTAKPLDGLGLDAQGAGRIDAAAAAGAPVVVSPALQDLGVQRWPHTDDQPVTSQLTYRNPTDQALTLELSLQSNGSFRLSQDRLVVPALGTATVEVVATTNHSGPDGRYQGTVTATAGGRAVRAQLIIDKEPESYDVTVDHVGRTGGAAEMYLGFLRRYDNDEVTEVGGASTLTMRLAKGSYAYAGYIGDADGTASYLYRPRFVVDRDLKLDFDARTAEPIRMSGPDPAARVVTVSVYHRNDGDRYVAGVQEFGDGSTTFVGQQGPAGPVPGLRSYATATLVTDRPSITKLMWSRDRRFYTGVDETAAAAELATVDAHIAAQAAGRTGFVTASATGPDWSLPAEPAASTRTPLPGVVRVHLHAKAADQVNWSIRVAEVDDTGRELNHQVSAPRRYRAGRVTSERWNEPVFAPAPGRAERTGPRIEVDIPQFGDSAGHTGRSRVDGGYTKLYRGDELVAGVDDPGRLTAEAPRAGRYRLEIETRRTAALSSLIRTTWSFAVGPGTQQLPLWMSRWRPLPDGTVELQLLKQPGSRTGRARTPEVAYSVDGGQTWRQAAVRAHGNSWRLQLGQGTVALRLTMRDSNGNTVQQTITDALHR